MIDYLISYGGAVVAGMWAAPLLATLFLELTGKSHTGLKYFMFWGTVLVLSKVGTSALTQVNNDTVFMGAFALSALMVTSMMVVLSRPLPVTPEVDH